MSAIIFNYGNSFLQTAGKIAKLWTSEKFVPLGIYYCLLTNGARIFNVVIQTNLGRFVLKSSVHNSAYISPPVCTSDRLMFGKGVFFVFIFFNMPTNPTISQNCIYTSHFFGKLRYILLFEKSLEIDKITPYSITGGALEINCNSKRKPV